MRFQWLWNAIRDSYFFVIILWLIAVRFMITRQTKNYKRFLYISSAVYAVLLLYVTLWGRHIGSEYKMELSFLWEYRLALKGDPIWIFQIVSNIILFLPLGWLYGAFSKKPHWYLALPIGCLVSCAIELLQLVLKLGWFEYDDILNNTIGMMIGYYIYYCLYHKRKA